MASSKRSIESVVWRSPPSPSWSHADRAPGQCGNHGYGVGACHRALQHRPPERHGGQARFHRAGGHAVRAGPDQWQLYDPAAQSYSECFASENATEPTGRLALRGDCPDAGFSMRADVTVAAGPAPNLQEWSVAVVSWAALNQIGTPVAVYKDNR